MQKTICTDQKQSSKERPPENRGKKGRNKEEGEGGRRRNKCREKVNLISPGKLDSPAFCNSCFRAAASLGETERVRREREKKKGRREGWLGGRWEGGEGREREDKSMQGESRGREGGCGPLSHRQTAINKSIGNCGWLGLGGRRMEKRETRIKVAPRWMERGEEWRRGGGGRQGGRVQ